MEEQLKKLINGYTYTYSEEDGELHIELYLDENYEIEWMGIIPPSMIYESIAEKGYMDGEDEELLVDGEERHIHPIIALMQTIYRMDELKYQLIALSIAFASQDMNIRNAIDWDIDICA